MAIMDRGYRTILVVGLLMLGIVFAPNIHMYFKNKPKFQVGDCVYNQPYNLERWEETGSPEIIYKIIEIGKRQYNTIAYFPKYNSTSKPIFNPYISDNLVKVDCNLYNWNTWNE